jgi:hypothetical protein
MTKVGGVGFAGPVPDDVWQKIETAWTERGATVQVELPCLADPSIASQLTRRGYELVGFENVLGRALDTGASESIASSGPDRADGEFDIAVSGPDERALWTDIVVTGFMAADTQGVPSHESFPRDAMERSVADMASANGMVHFMARRNGEPAAVASMRICDNIVEMCGAATLPEHRRRGAHTALLQTRLQHAIQAGCDLATITAQPGSKSHQNAQQRGFELLYTRAILVRGPK